MKKELFFHPINDYTGSTRVLANLIESEYSKDSVSVITYNPDEGFLSHLSNVHIFNIWQPTVKGKPIKALSFICYILNASFLTLFVGCKYREFYINTTQPFYAALLGRVMGKKITYHVHEVFPHNSVTRKLLRDVFDKTVAHRVFVSNYTKSQYPDTPGCTSEVKYNKLGLHYLEGVVFRPIDSRSRKEVLMIAALTKAKGVWTFMDVAKVLSEYHFSLVLSAKMEDILAFFDNQVPSNVTLVPVQSDVRPFLEKSDLLLTLSIPEYGVETFGMTILEAMPYGIPAVVPNIGGPAELVEDGYNGYCVDVTNINDVALAIRKSLEKINYYSLCSNTLKRFEKFI